MEDSLIITYDNCPPDAPTLIVARKDKYDMTMLKIVHGDEAFGIYQKEKASIGCRNAARRKNGMRRRVKCWLSRQFLFYRAFQEVSRSNPVSI